MKVNFVTEMTGFYRFTKTSQLSPNAQLLWYKLFLTWNEAGFPDWLQIDTRRLMALVGLDSKKVLCRARDELIEAGLLIKDRLSHKFPNRYQFVLFGQPVKTGFKTGDPSGYQPGDPAGDQRAHPQEGLAGPPKNPARAVVMGPDGKGLAALGPGFDPQTGDHQGADTGPDRGHQPGPIYKPNKTKQKSNKNAYGEFRTVLLTDEEFEKLKDEFPLCFEEWIKRLDTGKAMKGYRYENDYAAILQWHENDAKKARDEAYQELLEEWECYIRQL